MGGDLMKYISLAGLLILVYLLVFYGDKSTRVINALSGANTNAILALQGRNPQQAFG